MIDLKPFCGTDVYRSYLHQPFSQGDFTYATNGHICMRVPRREDAPEQDKVNPSAMPWDKAQDFAPLPMLTLPEKSTDIRECDECYDGYEHDCPDCECICEACHGTNQIDFDSDEKMSVDLFGIPFALRYVRLLMTLPGVQISLVQMPTFDAAKGLAFRFEGGDGLLMPLRERYKEHIGGEAP